MAAAEVISRLEAVVSRLEATASRLGGGGSGGDTAPAVAEYQVFLDTYVAPFVATCNHFNELKSMGASSDEAFKHVKVVLDAQYKCKKPDQNALLKFIDPIVKVVTNAQKCDNRSAFFNHQKAYSEFINLMNWLLIPGPSAHVSSTLDASDFYLTKILTLAKDANDADKKAHRDFVAQIKNIIKNLTPIIDAYFKLGLNWNPKGVDLASYNSNASSSAAASAGAGGGVPPPPPVDPNVVLGGDVPPPPPCDPNVQLSDNAGGAGGAGAGAGAPKPGGMAAVFDSINKGDSITTGLKKVTSDMKTKNMKHVPILETKPSDSSSSSSSSVPPSKPKAEPKKEPKLELRQGTWFVENYDNQAVEVSEGQMKQNVYIFNCNGAMVTIKDKVKSVQVDKCTKLTVIFSSVVSTFELVNCKRMTIQVLESCPALSVDKSSGVQIVLTPDSVKAPPNIITSNVTELNLVVPGATADADPIELPLPEQYLTLYENGKVVTTPIKHSGN